MNLPLLLLLISFTFLLAINPKERIKPLLISNKWLKPMFTKKANRVIKPLFTAENYMEDYQKIKYEPRQECPCGKDILGEMTLAYFQWIHPETQKMQLARYLISKTFFTSGGVGVVFHGTLISYPENKAHKCVAVKMAKNVANENINEIKRNIDIIEREIDVIKSFRGANNLIGYGPRHYIMPYKEPPANAIVMQIGQSFAKYWAKVENYSEELMLKVLKQILFGISKIHEKNFVHLDIKIDNILKMPNNNENDDIYLKLIDFGGAIELKNVDKITSFNMKPEFAAPEIIVPKYFEMDDSKIVSCLKWKPEERPTAEELLKGEHFKDISTPTENADFFGDITNYLDEQFKEISKYLKSKKFTKRLLHPLVRFTKHKVSKFKILNRKKQVNKDVLKNTNEFYGNEQQTQNHQFVEENIHHHMIVSKDKARFHETELEQSGNMEGHHEIQKHMEEGEGQTSKHGEHENVTSSTPFHSARHFFEHLEENSPHSTPFHTAPNSPEREFHSSSSTSESEIQLADESEKSVDFGKNILSSTELSPAQPEKTKEIAIKKKSCCDHAIVFLKKAAKFCGNCLLGPANYYDELKKKAKKEVQKN